MKNYTRPELKVEIIETEEIILTSSKLGGSWAGDSLVDWNA